jgi:glutathione S-transferase
VILNSPILAIAHAEPASDAAVMQSAYVLVGMLDSPFVRRVAVALELYELPYENLPLRTVGDADKFSAYSPLKRAPTLVLPDGEPVFDSHLILEELDDVVAPELRLLPASKAERVLCRQVTGVATGLADKAVSAAYERIFHVPEHQSARMLDRIRGQFSDSLKWLEQRAPRSGFLFGSRLSHADIAVGTSLCFAREALADMLSLGQAPHLANWCQRIDATPAFAKTYLAVDLPK